MASLEPTAARDCAALLRQGLALVEELPDEHYAFAAEDAIWSSPGAHTRHVVDYFDCLFAGIDARVVDYTARKRRPEVEASRAFGARHLERCIERLGSISRLDERLALDVRAEHDEDRVGSTLGRELRFVAGHTVHHHALIRMTLSRRGVSVPDEYGVSASTLAHRRALASGVPEVSGAAGE